jgi:hypothetical protein
VSKMTKLLPRLLIVLTGISLVVLAVPKAFADLIEYALVVALIALAATVGLNANLPTSSGVVIDQLETSIQGAQAAHLSDDPAAELSRLSKTAGAAQALIGMTSACSNCSELQDTLQQITGQVALLKTEVVGVSRTCHPNGVIQPNEQCDPLVTPFGGCPVGTAVTYCSDECRCEEVPTIP